MKLRKWEDLPDFMKMEEVKNYYKVLERKKGTLFLKRSFDIIVALSLLILLSPAFVILAIAIKKDSQGPVFYRQVRVTQYGRKFRIFKFRTMVQDADKKGTHVTTQNDCRITKVGEKIRNSRLDEIPQLLNILSGDMTFVGTRPEAITYVEKYTPEMYATLLLPAGVTSRASILFKDEAELLKDADDIDETYVTTILPQKMKYNLESIKKFGIWDELKILLQTVLAVL